MRCSEPTAQEGIYVTGLLFGCFYVSDITVACNGYTYGSHAAYVCQVCQLACLARIGSIERRLVYSFAAGFTDLSLRPSTFPTASVASCLTMTNGHYALHTWSHRPVCFYIIMASMPDAVGTAGKPVEVV